MKIRLYSYLLLGLILCGCKGKKAKVHGAEGVSVEFIKENSKAGYIFDDINIYPDAWQDHAEGILIQFNLNENTKNGMPGTAYMESLKLLSPDGKVVSLDTVSFQFSFAYHEYNYYKRGAFFIPYHTLKLPAGKTTLVIQMEGCPAMRDTANKTTTNAYLKLKEEPDAMCNLKLTYTQPEVFKGRLAVEGFDLDQGKADSHSFDFRLVGPGYPDLYWKTEVDGSVIYKSPAEENVLAYKPHDYHPILYFTKKDSIIFSVMDADGMSSDDKVGEWTGSPFMLMQSPNHSSTLSFDSVANCKLRIESP